MNSTKALLSQYQHDCLVTDRDCHESTTSTYRRLALRIMVPHHRTRPFASLEEPIPALLGILQDFLPMHVWMVGRVISGRWTVIEAQGHGGQVTVGTTFSSTDLFCKCIALSRQVPFVHDTRMLHNGCMPSTSAGIAIRSYIGYPLISHLSSHRSSCHALRC